MSSSTALDVWILGATGRSGRSIAANLAAKKIQLVLVGRQPAELEKLAAEIGGKPRIVVLDSIESMAGELKKAGAIVVVNCIGPFTQTVLPIVHACAAGSHYVDISNEFKSFISLFECHYQAVSSARCLVTGGGWGCTGTESITVKLCEKQPAALRVRVDMIPFVESQQGRVGPTLAATLIDGLAEGGYCYQNGRLISMSLGSGSHELVLPDGSNVRCSALPFGEMEAARRASGAPNVISGSSMAPSGLLVRVLMPLVVSLMWFKSVREFAKAQIANIETKPKPPAEGERRESWAHSKVEWSDGSIRQGWLRAGEASVFTARVASEVAERLARNQGRPGAYTPAALFGTELAVTCGAQYIID